MSNIEFLTGDGASVGVDSAAVEAFRGRFSGSILLDGDAGYDDTRQVWNAMIDRRPAMIALCQSTDDVVAAVQFAAQYGLLTSIHGAGHNIAGNAICDKGLQINLSEMNEVRVDTAARRAHVGPGATLGDVDAATLPHGLATPVGINTTTGIAGLTLGGGFGWLSRKLGLTVDNLVAADVVTADGKMVRAAADENDDLFWALRGGGGNFGVVTRFEFALHEAGPDLLTGLIVFPFSEARSVLEKYRAFTASAPEEFCAWSVLRQAPPLPFLPEEVHGTNVVVLALCHLGDAAEGGRLVDTLRTFGNPLGEHVGVQPFQAWQSAFDPLLAAGARNYWKSHNFVELADGALDTVIDYAGKLPSSQCEIFIAHIQGAPGRVPVDATAYSHRDANYVLNVHGRWDDAADDERGISWARSFFNESAQYATGGVYINFMSADEVDRVRAGYGANFDRLLEIKRKYDPKNLFRMNQNISAGA